MSDPSEVVKTISEDPGLLQRGLMISIGAVGTLVGIVFRQSIKANQDEIQRIKFNALKLSEQFQTLEDRTDAIERDFIRTDRFEAQMQRLYEKIDANQRDVMTELLRRRENHRGGE